MKFRPPQDDQAFLSDFDAFWRTLEAIERKYRYLSLDPRRRYWIDTYPPMTMWMDARNRGREKAGLNLEAAARESREEIFSLYFHIGFCRRRCAYCRQYEINLIRDPARSDLLQRYVGALKQDIDISVSLFPALQRRTRGLYFGGGTPSLLPPRLLGSLLEHLLERVDLSVLSPQSTYEINPEDQVDELLKILAAVAIPRISIGVQSFDDRVLRSVGRRHSGSDILRLIESAAKHAFKSVNIDLINGFPAHRDFGNWKRELGLLAPLFESGAVHSVTLYMLHPFPGTNLPCSPADSFWQTRNLSFAREYLCGRLQLYEKPVYWFQKGRVRIEEAFAPSFSIFGYGNSSYSSLGRWLLQNEPSLEAYLAHKRGSPSESTLPVRHAYRLTPRQAQIRSLLFAVRSGAFRLERKNLDRMGAAFKNYFKKLMQDGLLERRRDLYRLTEAGKIFAHQIPIFFFDPQARKNLEGYLDFRFALSKK